MLPQFNFAPFLEQLARDIRGQKDVDHKPINVDTFVARSILQKAIRRGETDLALRATATLLRDDPQVLWRRLLVIALEDLGIYEWKLLGKIAVAESSKVLRASVGTELEVATALVTQACEGTRCQAANELHILGRFHPYGDDVRRAMRILPVRDALDLAGNPQGEFIGRYVGVLFCLGQDQPTSSWPKPLVPIEELFDRITGPASPEIAALYAWTFKRTRLPLACGSLLLHAVNGTPVNDEEYTHDDKLPPVAWIGETPSFALDQYTRGGRAAISSYVRSSRRWIGFAGKLGLSHVEQCKTAGELFFRVESAAVTRRRSWDIARVIRDKAWTIGCHIPVPIAEKGLDLAFAEVGCLNLIRSSLV